MTAIPEPALIWHPFAERFPLLDGSEYQAFLDSIRQSSGNETPILYRVLSDGRREYLDGRNRQRACAELALPCKAEEVILPDQDVKDYILRRNVHRRHLTPELRRTIVAELTADGKSTREIAASLGVSKDTVNRDQKAVVSNETTEAPPSPPPAITGRDGKRYHRGAGRGNQSVPSQESEPGNDTATEERQDAEGHLIIEPARSCNGAILKADNASASTQAGVDRDGQSPIVIATALPGQPDRPPAVWPKDELKALAKWLGRFSREAVWASRAPSIFGNDKERAWSKVTKLIHRIRKRLCEHERKILAGHRAEGVDHF